MSKHNKPVQTSQPPNEIPLLKTQVSRLSQEYQNLFQQALNYKEAAYQNALAANSIIRQVTNELLNLETNDAKILKKINQIVKTINKTEQEQVVQNQQSSIELENNNNEN